jgi:hypothetical protein
MNKRDNFLEQLRRAQSAKAPARGKAPAQEKPIEEMSMEELDDAEDRVKESLALRGGVLPHHTYPGREHDLEVMRAYHGEHGVPPVGFFRRLLWRMRGRA